MIQYAYLFELVEGQKMDEEIISVKYMSKRLVPGLGQVRIEVVYVMTHTKHGRVNKYRVTCDICGIEVHDPHLHVNEAEYIGDPESTNDETLTSEAAGYLFEDNANA